MKGISFAVHVAKHRSSLNASKISEFARGLGRARVDACALIKLCSFWRFKYNH
jgi:hypothetical protein